MLMCRHSGHPPSSRLSSCCGTAGAAWLVSAAEVPGSGASSLDDIPPCERHKVCLQVALLKTLQLSLSLRGYATPPQWGRGGAGIEVLASHRSHRGIALLCPLSCFFDMARVLWLL